MRMGSGKKMKKITMQDEMYACPACDYTDGFHMSFEKCGTAQAYMIILICPQCHSRFATNWKAVAS